MPHSNQFEVCVRFIADGVDIPDELLWAQDEGRVVFFCGAGVSRAKANLPDFKGLTKQVLDDLGAAPDDEARRLFENLDGMDGLAVFDQVFQRLRRSFSDADIGTKVARRLQPSDNADLSAHKILLKLAKLQTGETRIVTTNFDRLFEQCMPRMASVTRSSLPHLQFNEADWGIVHLHGCVLPDYSGPSRDGFVLSSAEFGDAYLALGWARDFVKHILERYVAVFVGYSAEDPPIRYLLEGLQQSKSTNNKAYAFQSAPNDSAVASWDEKGVQPLLYTTDRDDGHRCLWESLDAWGKRSAAPVKWRKRVFDLARKGPAKLAPHERGMLAHIVSSAAGAQAMTQHRPHIPSEWLCVFDPVVRYGEPGSITGPYSGGPVVDPFDRYRLDADPPPRAKGEGRGLKERIPEGVWSAFNLVPGDYRELNANQVSSIRGYFARRNPYLPRRLSALAHWIASVADQPAAAWWAGQQGHLHYEIMEGLRLLRAPSAKGHAAAVIEDAWRAIAEYHDLHANDRDPAYELRLRADKGAWHESLAREYARNFSPTLKLNPMWRVPVPPAASRKLRRNDLVHVDVEYSDGIKTISVPDGFLPSLIGKLRAGLELAEDLEKRYSYGIDISSIEPDPSDEDDDSSFSRSYKLTGHVLHYVGLFKRLAQLNPDAARIELSSWPRNSRVFERLRIWALGNLTLLPARMYADELIALSKEEFWPFRGERDLLLGLSKRWGEFDPDTRKAIERLILKGPPRSSSDEEKVRSAHWRLSRLNWLHSKGCEFSFDLDAQNKKLRTQAPDWKPEYAAHAAESKDGRSGWVRTETDFSGLDGLEPAEIITHVQAMERRPDRGFVTFEPFLGLSQKDPDRALAALNASRAAENFDPSFWRTFLRVDVRKDDKQPLQCNIGKALVALSDAELASVVGSSASWFEAAGKVLLDACPKTFEALWRKFIAVLSDDEEAGKSTLVREDRAVDWATEAINSPAGDLAELVFIICPEVGEEGFLPAWLKRLEQLLALPGNARRYALVIIGFHLVWLFHHGAKWTEKMVLSVFDDEAAPQDDRDAIWAGIFWRAEIPRAQMYRRLKPQMIAMVKSSSPQRDRHTEILAGILLAGWRPMKTTGEQLVSSQEMRTLLLEGGDDFRLQILYNLDRWSGDDEEGGWSNLISSFLSEAWPKQKNIRTPQISARLAELALSQKGNFEAVAEQVSGLVSKVTDDRIFIPELRSGEDTVAIQYPEAMLGLLYAVLPENRAHWPWGAEAALKALAERQPGLRSDPRFIELEGRLQ